MDNKVHLSPLQGDLQLFGEQRLFAYLSHGKKMCQSTENPVKGLGHEIFALLLYKDLEIS